MAPGDFAPTDKYDAALIDFNFGGGTYPEIDGFGALSLNQMLLVGDNREAVGTLGIFRTRIFRFFIYFIPFRFYSYNKTIHNKC